MNTESATLIKNAKEILYGNLIIGFTVPSKGLYPFQWNWDSAFVSIGLSHFDLDAAFSELRCLVKGQWKNGMIPHIIFHSEKEVTYFPNWDFWNAQVNPGAPDKPKTSGITQPPALGFALECIYNKYPNNPKVIDFVKEMYPKILEFHRFWYEYRDPNREGLVFIYHPWESGRDNSPLWDEPLNRIDLNSIQLPEYKRRDTTIAAADERPTSKQYDQYVYLIELGKKHQYEGPGIVEESEYLIQDTLINAALIRSNQALINLGKEFGFDTGQVQEWQQQSIKCYEEKLWNEKLETYTCYDLRAEKQLAFREIGGFIALYAGLASQERAEKMKSYLEDLSAKGYMLVPSFDVEHEYYDSKRYWRGPIWSQMNWMIYHGLKQYSYNDIAQVVKNDFLELVSRYGFYEYFEAQKHLLDTTHGGYGGNYFSWTSSLVIDLILSE